MDAEPIIPPPDDDDFEPSQPARRGRLRRFFLPLAVVAGVGSLVVAAGWSPAFHRQRLPVGGPLDGRTPEAARMVAEQSARRLVTAAAATHAEFLREGRWGGVFDERSVNAWLAIDMPRNHAAVLPESVRDPRVEFQPGRLLAGVRMGPGSVAATVWVEAEVALREPNQLGITLAAAGVGALPLPRGPILRWIAGRLDRLGVVTEIRPQGDRGLLVVYIPSTHQAGGVSHWLEAVRLSAGELAIAGETRRGAIRSEPGR